MLELNKVYQGDWIDLLKQLDDESIDMCITSPPYWGLRDYGVEGQLGLEEHPNFFISKLVEGFRLLRKKLKKTGSFYLNLGDTYFGGGGWSGMPEDWDSISARSKQKRFEPPWKRPSRDAFSEAGMIKNCLYCGREFKGKEGSVFCSKECLNKKGKKGNEFRSQKRTNWLQPKQLMLMPSRVAIAMQEDGWILRNDIIWHKPNPMPSSVKDRLNTTFEHIFHFVKSRKYYYDLDAIREPHQEITKERVKYGWDGKKAKEENCQWAMAWGSKDIPAGSVELNPLGKNPGDAFFGNPPTGWNKCGEHSDGKNPGDVLKQDNVPGKNTNMYKGFNKRYEPREDGKNPGDFWNITTQPFPEAHFAVFPEELCVKPIKSSCPEKGVVLDIFCGSGTALVVAKKLGRNYIGFDLKKEYCEMAEKRLKGYSSFDFKMEKVHKKLTEFSS